MGGKRDASCATFALVASLGIAYLRGSLLFAGVYCSIALRCSAREPAFIALGDLPGGDYYSEAVNISSDGSIVVGASLIDKDEAFSEACRWTREEGLLGLGTDLSVRGTIGVAISGDGQVIAGTISDEYPERSVFLWTESEGMRRLLGGVLDSVSALSHDGKVVVGRLQSPFHAFRWTEETGAIDLGHLPTSLPGVESYANDVSADGSIVVGGSQAGIGGLRAFKWTAAEGMVGLPDFGVSGPSDALSISDEGTTIVGRATIAKQGTQAVMWKSTGESIVLGDLPGGLSTSQAAAVSADGSIVVGVGNSARGLEAFRWSEESGMRTVQSILTDLGVDLPGWRLENASAVSADGAVITGRAINPDNNVEAFVAVIPPNYIPEPESIVLMWMGTWLAAARSRMIGEASPPPILVQSFCDHVVCRFALVVRRLRDFFAD